MQNEEVAVPSGDRVIVVNSPENSIVVVMVMDVDFCYFWNLDCSTNVVRQGSKGQSPLPCSHLCL